MGLFDSLAGKLDTALSSTAHGEHGVLANAAIELIHQAGGLQGLVHKLQAGGLGEAVASWVGTGANQTVTGAQVLAALGNSQVAAIAQKLGIDPASAANGLAGVLPGIVDKLTPHGNIPEGDMLHQGLALLKGFGK
jgi:uncharacterized protein YidB (DUF937 family)